MIIPHGRFVDYQDRRHKKAVQPVQPDGVLRCTRRGRRAGRGPVPDSPDATAPVLDIEGTWDQLDAVASALQAALMAKRLRAATAESDPVQIMLPHAAPGTESDG